MPPLFRLFEDAPFNEGDVLNFSNVRKLTPWFDELQMEGYLSRCDEILNNEVEDVTAGKPEDLDGLVELLSFAVTYNLGQTQRSVGIEISRLLETFLWGFGDAFHLRSTLLGKRVVGLNNTCIIDKILLNHTDNCSITQIIAQSHR
eukprot:scaffold50477_cov32-Cyclotella_meneghiniana.AAC.2